MHKVAVVGTGIIGTAIIKMLAQSGDFQLLAIDSDEQSLEALPEQNEIKPLLLTLSETEKFADAVKGCEAIVSCCPYHENLRIAEVALQVGASYFDLTEDNETTEAIKALSKEAKDGQVFIPQCGLAPGFIVILASHVCRQFDQVDSLKLRVGALPEFPSNQMMYNLTWNTEGLINEYCNPCHAIRNGELVDLIPLEGLEIFSLDGVEYEAFNTSGGLGTLCDSLKGKLKELTYKTIRYRGHQYLMDFLINGLKLGEQRNLLKQIFENAVAATKQDVVVVTVSATGQLDGRLSEKTDSRKIYHADMFGEHWSAIQITTAAGLCAVVDLYFRGAINQQGFVSQESIDFNRFINNRFGKYYNHFGDLGE